MTRKILLLAMTALMFVQGGCRKSNVDDGRVTICFAFQDLETEYWVAAHKAITETLRAKGIKVIERNANQDANKQLLLEMVRHRVKLVGYGLRRLADTDGHPFRVAQRLARELLDLFRESR